MNINNWMLLHRFMAKVLVTGFEPFSNHSTNISGDLLKILGKSEYIDDPWSLIRDYTLEPVEIDIETSLLSVDEFGAKEIAKRIADGERWDAVIHLGLCSTCEIAKIELKAHNILDMKIKDNSGRQIQNHKLGEADQISTIESNIIFTNRGEIKAEISDDAGRYICNETYYNTLLEIRHSMLGDENIPCLFLHLPDYSFCSLDSARNLLFDMIGRILFKPVISVAAAAIIDNNRILVARRNDENNTGLWEFPGGKFEWGENASQAVVRELDEEFSWNVKSIQSFGKWFHKMVDFDIDLNVEICQFIGKLPDFNLQEKWTSHDEIKWITDEDEVSPYVGLDKLVAQELCNELSNPSGRFS